MTVPPRKKWWTGAGAGAGGVIFDSGSRKCSHGSRYARDTTHSLGFQFDSITQTRIRSGTGAAEKRWPAAAPQSEGRDTKMTIQPPVHDRRGRPNGMLAQPAAQTPTICVPPCFASHREDECDVIPMFVEGPSCYPFQKKASSRRRHRRDASLIFALPLQSDDRRLQMVKRLPSSPGSKSCTP